MDVWLVVHLREDTKGLSHSAMMLTSLWEKVFNVKKTKENRLDFIIIGNGESGIIILKDLILLSLDK